MGFNIMATSHNITVRSKKKSIVFQMTKKNLKKLFAYVFTPFYTMSLMYRTEMAFSIMTTSHNITMGSEKSQNCFPNQKRKLCLHKFSPSIQNPCSAYYVWIEVMISIRESLEANWFKPLFRIAAFCMVLYRIVPHGIESYGMVSNRIE